MLKVDRLSVFLIYLLWEWWFMKKIKDITKDKIFYILISLLFIFLCFTFLSNTDINNNVSLSITLEIIFILYLVRISYGCIIYIKNQYKKSKYSYSIIMNLGLLIFININILRLINLLIVNFDEININSIYNNTLESFNFFTMLTLPFIVILSIYSIISNIVLIKKERFSPYNLLGIFLGVFALIGLFGSQIIYSFTNTLTLS